MEWLDPSTVACESIVAREECGNGEVLDMRLAFFRRTLETGNSDSGDLSSSFSPKQQVGYRRPRDYEIREYRDSILESVGPTILDMYGTSEDGFANTSALCVNRLLLSLREILKAVRRSLVSLSRSPCPLERVVQRILP